MTIEERMDRLERSAGKNDDMVRELRDAVTVTAQLEARQSHLLKYHNEWLVSHTEAVKRHDEAMKLHDEAMKKLDERISGLVSGFGEFMRRAQP